MNYIYLIRNLSVMKNLVAKLCHSLRSVSFDIDPFAQVVEGPAYVFERILCLQTDCACPLGLAKAFIRCHCVEWLKHQLSTFNKQSLD